MGSVVRQKRIAIKDGKLTEKHQRWMKILGKRMNHASFCHPINRPTQTLANVVVVICLYYTAVACGAIWPQPLLWSLFGQPGRLYLKLMGFPILYSFISCNYIYSNKIMPLFLKKKRYVAVLSTSKSTQCTPLNTFLLFGLITSQSFFRVHSVREVKKW